MKVSRPGRGPIFGKRTEVMKTLVDPETKLIHEQRARALGYATLSEYLSEKLIVDAHGLAMVTSMHADRLRAVAGMGTEPVPPAPAGGPEGGE